MENFTFLNSTLDCHKYIYEKIMGAKKVIYLSAWRIDLSYKLLQEQLYKILLKKCEEGVKVFILTSVSPGTDVNYKNRILKNIKHPNFHFKVLDMEGSSFLGLLPLINFITPAPFSIKKCCNRLYHQRYFNVDNIYCMLGACDIDGDLNSSINIKMKNISNYYWIEYGVIFNPTPEFISFCNDNFHSSGKSSIISPYFYGNFTKINTEYSKILELIGKSKKSITIEQQWIYSNDKTKNKIFKIIGDKLIQNIKSNNDYKVNIISNFVFADMCTENENKLKCVFVSIIFKFLFIINSLRFLYKYLKLHNITDEQINKHLIIYKNTKELFIHGKHFIIDSKEMLYGTTNLWDRSYTPNKDIELSILLKGPKIKDIENNILNNRSNKINLKNEIQVTYKEKLSYAIIILILSLILLILVYLIYIIVNFFRKGKSRKFIKSIKSRKIKK